MADYRNMFDSLDPDVLARKASVKWSRDPDDVLACWVADMDFPIAPPIRRAMEEIFDGDDLGYPGYDIRDGLRQAFVDRMADRFGWEVELDDTWLLTTVVQGLHIALTILSEPGDGVLVQTPIYTPFLKAIDALDRRQDHAELALVDGRRVFDAQAFEAAIDDRTKVLMLCNPHNPTGRVFTDGELEEIGELVLRHDLWVIADEIHQDIVYPGSSHRVFATLSEDLAQRTITLTSASKAFNLAGNRCAVIHFGNPEHRAALETMTHRLVGEVSLLGHATTLAAWTDPESDLWFTELLGYLDDNRQWLAEALATRLPEARYSMPEGTYLAWVDLSAYGLGDNPSGVLLTEAKVALGCGPEYGPPGVGHVRLNLATSRSILEQILDRITTYITNR